VTRGELRAELEQLELRFEQKLAPLVTKTELEQKLAPLATKTELEFWGGALLARIESGEQRTIRHLIQRMDGLEQRLIAELARHTRASSESMSAQIAAIDQQYADLPPRVRRLETKVFPPKRR
jgi:hypothetical protein